jgi:hypothetical protein
MMREHVVIEYLGWTATAVFVGSYFCARPSALKRVQMVGALMWVAYGLLIGASPVVAANLLVFGAAAWTMSAGVNGVDGVNGIHNEGTE